MPWIPKAFSNDFDEGKIKRDGDGKFAPTEGDNGGGGDTSSSRKTPLGGHSWEMSSSEYKNVTSASKVVEKIVSQTEGAAQTKTISERVRGEASRYREREVNISDLSIEDVENVDPNRASTDKGAIVVDSEGDIIDGRHRAAAAKARGQTTIKALVPTQDNTSHKKVIEKALQEGKDVPGHVLDEYPDLKEKHRG